MQRVLPKRYTGMYHWKRKHQGQPTKWSPILLLSPYPTCILESNVEYKPTIEQMQCVDQQTERRLRMQPNQRYDRFFPWRQARHRQPEKRQKTRVSKPNLIMQTMVSVQKKIKVECRSDLEIRICRRVQRKNN